MKNDLDMKLYQEYLKGDKDAFALLYNKYRTKIEYFIFNIVKDQQKAEDITQEVFVDIIQNGVKEEYSFKYHIFLLAKSRALNYLNIEKRRKEINEKYIFSEKEKLEKDALEIITQEETKKELLNAINMLDEKYRNAMYLVKIEELSYKETADILGETLQNTKNLVHRGKNELRKILIQKGFNEMNKLSKVIAIVIGVTILLSGIVYATAQIIKTINRNNNVTFNASYLSPLDEHMSNNIWVGSFELAWKELAQRIGKNGIIELEEESQIANDLNKSKFSKEMLSEKDYTISVIQNDRNGYNIYASLNKNLSFLYSFDNFNDYCNKTFSNGEEYIKYFGINGSTSEKADENVEVLFYNKRKEDFAVKLKTKEGDEIILYRTNDTKSFNEYYEDILNKANAYTGEKTFGKKDELFIPYINLNGRIRYNELQGKHIKDRKGMYIKTAEQDVNFHLTEKGCNLNSNATFVNETFSIENSRHFEYEDTFIIFMKEKNIKEPYFALKVDNSDILEKKQVTETDIQILDKTTRQQLNVINEEYKFYEDESYEYYYPTSKTKYVQVYYKDGQRETVEEALKNGKISMDLLDKYDIEYFKRKK